MKPGDVTHLTDGPTLWKEAIDGAASRASLTHVLSAWQDLFPDAWEARPTTHAEFVEWRRGLASERKPRPKFAGPAWAARYGAILLPGDLLRAGMLAEQFKTPWGCAYIRMKELEPK